DGGASYTDLGTDPFLREETRIGCNASFLRVEREELREELCQRYLPAEVDSLTVFINPRSEKREKLTACVSFDSGKTWKEAKCFYKGACAYSSLDYSPTDGLFHLIYEKGVEKPYSLGISAVEFDLEWLLS
ncbi:MAG: exo-alpha-sialidase, partial [Clostridia bacterium]|nr:exo-alpha-sialidase [Clostridia bacterium]